MGTSLKCLLNCTPAERYKNLGEVCWLDCARREGACAWCGTEGLCCRGGSGNGCEGRNNGGDLHICVKNEGKEHLKEGPLGYENIMPGIVHCPVLSPSEPSFL